MGTYVENSLLGGETLLYQGRVSIWSLAPQILLGLVTFPVFGLGLVFWVAAFIRYRTTELGITNKRVIAKFGFIQRRTVELNLNKIEGVQVDQGILGRICNFGSLVISGTGGSKEPIPNISDPLAFRKAFAGAHDAVVSRG